MSLSFQPPSLANESDKNSVQNSDSTPIITTVTSGQDFSFLINIIRSLEKTIVALNRRLEAYENQNQNDSGKFKMANEHSNNTKIGDESDRFPMPTERRTFGPSVFTNVKVSAKDESDRFIINL